jgi:negative regulator of sigma E activity
MVTGTHPEDVELFDYVEGDLPRGRRAELKLHLASCARCTEQVARVQAGRDALRAAPFLELPPAHRAAILRDLPARPRSPERAPWLSAKRLVAALATVAVVAAAVVAVVTTGDGSTGEEAAATGAGGGATQELATPQDAKAFSSLKAPGPAAAVADELRREGIAARVVGDHVEVHGATRSDVRRALADRRTVTLSHERVEIVIIR